MKVAGGKLSRPAWECHKTRCAWKGRNGRSCRKMPPRLAAALLQLVVVGRAGCIQQTAGQLAQGPTKPGRPGSSGPCASRPCVQVARRGHQPPPPRCCSAEERPRTREEFRQQPFEIYLCWTTSNRENVVRPSAAPPIRGGDARRREPAPLAAGLAGSAMGKITRKQAEEGGEQTANINSGKTEKFL